MTIEKQRLTCGDCKHVFDEDMVTGARLAIAIAMMRAIVCPKCGGGKLYIGGAYKGAPPKTSSIAERAAWWIEKGSVGTSSATIWAAMTGGRAPRGHYDIPYDPDDYSRCRALLDLIPEWRADLSPVAERFPWFAPFLARWSEFDQLWDLESSSGYCPDLYDLMKVAERESNALQDLW